MVLLTMTAAIVEALQKIQSLETSSRGNGDPVLEELGNSNHKKTIHIKDRNTDDKDEHKKREALQTSRGTRKIERHTKLIESILSNPKIGKPISHGQIIDISKEMKSRSLEPRDLETLLKGSKVYIASPPPKQEPTSEYKALMARLRREEEARSYERMTNPPSPMETFTQHLPASSAAHAFSSSHQPISASDPDDDGLTFADVDRQMALILNVLLSIVACAAAIWIAARWWSTPARLALSMSGSILVGVAEVVVYSGYIRRVGEAKGKEKSVKEVKEIVKTWVIGAGQDFDNPSGTPDDSIMIESKEDDQEMNARKRRKEQL